MNFKLTTAVRMFLGFSIAPLGLLLLALYGLSNLATLRDQATTIVNQDWPKIEPIMQIATGVRDNARNTRDLLLNKDNAQARALAKEARDLIAAMPHLIAEVPDARLLMVGGGPREAALKIQERDAQRIVLLNVQSEGPDEDDPYAAYQIPDDLMW